MDVTASRAQARQFLLDLNQLVANLRGAENEQRGYLLTGETAYRAQSGERFEKVVGGKK